MTYLQLKYRSQDMRSQTPVDNPINFNRLKMNHQFSDL